MSEQNATAYYLLIMHGDVEPDLEGPYSCEWERLEAARDFRKENGEESGLYRLNVPKGTEISVDTFSGPELEDVEHLGKPRLQALHGTQLTAEEQDAAEVAAWRVLGDIYPASAYLHNMLRADDMNHNPALADLWDEAEAAAIRAATELWWQTPEDLSLTIE